MNETRLSPQECVFFTLLMKRSLLYWCLYHVQFISMLGHLQVAQITLSIGFNLFRATEELICSDGNNHNANSLCHSEVHKWDCFCWETSHEAEIWLLKCCLIDIIKAAWADALLHLSASLNSPLTRTATCSRTVPMRFTTSQTKVVLTVSSTFGTLSTLSVCRTVAGRSPVKLEEHEHILMWEKKKGEKARKKINLTLCTERRTFTEMCCIVQCHHIQLILISGAKPISSPPSPKRQSIITHCWKYNGDRRKISIAGSKPKISSLQF